MAITINLRSKQNILGNLVRAIRVYTDITTVAPGSDMTTLLEAVAESLAHIEVSSLKILENSNLESLVGDALDKKGQSIQIPNGSGGVGRIPANQATGPVTIVDSTFNKISSKLYAGKPSPFSGSATLYVENAASFPASGNLYVGRGTVNRFEGPIPYSGVVNNGSFWTVTLLSPLSKTHLLSDSVVVAQGGDRKINARTVVQVPANNQTPAVQYQTDTQVVIPDGETTVTVTVTCSQSGELGNALAGTIVAFGTLPFVGATVTNPTSYKSGISTEDDESYRTRIKNYPSTLSRGTASAIRSAILGATDPDSGRTIQSANVLEPVEPGDYARVYIDDGTGLEPTFNGQPYELLLQSASGQETDFGTAQSPITAAIAIGSETGPFVLLNGMSITVVLDGLVETYTLTPSNYANLNAATAYEVVRDINTQSNLIGARTTNGGTGIVFLDLSGKGEQLQIESSTWQAALGLPTSAIRPVFLYKNSELLSFRGKTATLETRPFGQWNITATDMTDVEIIVDGVTQTFSMADSDFAAYGTTVASCTITQFASVLRSKVAGVQITISGQILVLSSWQALSGNGSLSIPANRQDGTPIGWVGDSKSWLTTASGGILSDTGRAKDYQFNRFTGEITLSSKLAAADKLEIGSRSTRAFIDSPVAPTGVFTLNSLPLTTGSSRLVLGFDGSFATRSVIVPTGSTLTPIIPDATNAPNVVRLSANNNSLFANAAVGDWLYLVKDASTVSWGTGVEGFYRVKAFGGSTFAANQTYSSLAASTNSTLTVLAQVVLGSNQVEVIQTAHGLQTGDLVTITATATIGGITGFNLSQTDAPITVINANAYVYTATSSATSTASGSLDRVSTNVITVTQTAHPFNDGDLATITTAASISSISGANLSSANTPVTSITPNTWQYRAAVAATTVASGTLASVQFIADAWIETEFSSPQLTAWSSLIGVAQPISSVMPYLFRSTTLPQLVDFGSSVASETVDSVVAAINSQIASGTAVKLTPQQFTIRSNDYRTQGTAAVLAVVGNAANLVVPSTATAIQAHTAYSPSGDVQGSFPVPQGISPPASPGYSTRTYIQVDKALTDIVDTNPNPTIQAPVSFVSSYPTGFEQMWLTGREAGLNTRVYNNQTVAPFTGIARGENMIGALNTADTYQTSSNNLNRYANFGMRLQDLPLNENDKLVVAMDLDSTNKTVSVPMYKLAKIQDINAIAGGGKGQVVSLRLSDPNDSDLPFFSPTSVYKSFDFTDFKILTKSVGLYRQDVSDLALIVRSSAYGATHKLRLSLQYAQSPSKATSVVSHYNNFASVAQQNLVVELPSGSLIAGSLLTQGNYHIKATAASTLFDWRITSGSLNSSSVYAPGNVLNISGNSAIAESYRIQSASYVTVNNPAATTTNTSPVVSVAVTGHGLQTGDLVTITAAAAIGGISATNLTRADTAVTVVDANTFTYVAGASATSVAVANLTAMLSGVVVVRAPGSGGMLSGATFSAPQSPIATWTTAAVTYQDIATAINAYLTQNPVASAQAIGAGAATTLITDPTYITYPNAVAFSGSDITDAFDWHSFATKYAGSAGIWQYDSSVPTANNIKATVQTDDALYPTTTDAAGTAYSPIGEEVILVPTNAKTLQAWMSFKAVSSLNILAAIDRVDNDTKVQISSLQDGASGAVQITGVSANGVATSVVGNGSDDNSSTRVSLLSADAKPLMTNQVVHVQNTLASEILRPYRLTPSGTAITSANTVNINTFFRQTNSIKYIRTGTNSGRIIFKRNGMDGTQTEPLQPGTDITLTSLGGGLVQVTSAVASGVLGSGTLSARTGDMMYVRPGTEFSVDVWGNSPTISTAGLTDGSNPEYIGYPVVNVIDGFNVVIIAPNITSFGTTSLVSSTSLVFMPAIYNEKNIRTNHKEGSKYSELTNNGKMYYLIKKLGEGFVSLFLQNSSAEATDTMLLDTMSVSTDDTITLGDGFDIQNQGTFKIIAHNGRNHITLYNPTGGTDEIIEQYHTSNGGAGYRSWKVGPIAHGDSRSVKVVAAESVKVGDLLRISGPKTNSQWFGSDFFGSWTITAIGYHAFTYSGALPNTPGVGSVDNTKICPYIDIAMPNAPVSVVDSVGAYVDSFLIGGNDSAIGFVEGTPFSAYRLVAGHGVDPDNAENSNVFLVPQINSSKMTSIYGSVVTALGKTSYDQSVHQGIDGYKIYTGLIQQAQDIIDGLPSNTVDFPGVKAAGTVVEVLTPLIRSISIALSVLPSEGVSLNSLSDIIKSSVSGYINGLGGGSSVVVSEIIAIVQGLPGVLSVSIISTLPVANNGSIVVSSTEKAFVLDSSSITVS